MRPTLASISITVLSNARILVCRIPVAASPPACCRPAVLYLPCCACDALSPTPLPSVGQLCVNGAQPSIVPSSCCNACPCCRQQYLTPTSTAGGHLSSSAIDNFGRPFPSCQRTPWSEHSVDWRACRNIYCPTPKHLPAASLRKRPRQVVRTARAASGRKFHRCMQHHRHWAALLLLTTRLRHLPAWSCMVMQAICSARFQIILSRSSSLSAASCTSLPQAPPDAILGISEAFKADTDARKVNLGVGAYRTEVRLH